MSTTTERETTEVQITPTTLLEAGIVALESGRYPQCIGHMADGERMRCAEGVLAEMLIAAYPERFAWWGEYLRDRSVPLTSASRHSALSREFWQLLHPHGARIAHTAALRLGYTTVAQLNDKAELSFAEIAAALRQAMTEIEGERP